MEETHERTARQGHGPHRAGDVAAESRRRLRHSRSRAGSRAASSARKTAARPGPSRATTASRTRSTTARSSPIRMKFDRVYIMDITVQVTEDGGKTFQPLESVASHVDNHASGIRSDRRRPPARRQRRRPVRDPTTAAENWRHFEQPAEHAVLPGRGGQRRAVLQRLWRHAGQRLDGRPVAHDATAHGIRTSDWGRTGGADGMQPRVDPTDPEHVYTESQNGGHRAARPRRPASTLDPSRSRHGKDPRFAGTGIRRSSSARTPHTRLYLAGSRLFRSDDRGDKWKAVSPDLTRQLDRDTSPR